MAVVAYTSRYVPVEVIAGAGHEVRFVRPSLGIIGDSFLKRREGLCPFAAGTVRTVFADGGIDAFVGAGVCDQSRRCFEELRRAWGKPVFLLNVPATSGAAAERMFAMEVERLGRFAADLPGGGNAEVKDGKICTGLEEDKRLAVIGAPLAMEGDVLMRMFGDEARDLTGPIRVHGKTGGGDLPRGGLIDVRERPNERWFEWLREFTQTGGIRGIVLHRYTWCDLWHGEVQRIKRASAVPVIELEVSDASSYGSASTVTRVQAFLEMIG